MEELIIKERQFREDLADVVNNSNLPAFIIKPIVKDLFEQLSMLEQQQYEMAQEFIEKNKKVKEEENGQD